MVYPSQTPEYRRAKYLETREEKNAARRAAYAASPERQRRRQADAVVYRQQNADVIRHRDRLRSADTLYFQAKTACVECGYARSTAALQWHHVDPATKVANPSNFKRKPDAETLVELMKCVLLCANCHWEVETGLWEVTDDHIARSAGIVQSAYTRRNPDARRIGDISPERPRSVPPEPASG